MSDKKATSYILPAMFISMWVAPLAFWYFGTVGASSSRKEK